MNAVGVAKAGLAGLCAVFVTLPRPLFAQVCRFRGDDVRLGVDISPKDHKPFSLGVWGWPATIDFEGSRDPKRSPTVAVDGVVSFQGAYAAFSTRFDVSKAVTVADGMVRLDVGATLEVAGRGARGFVTARHRLGSMAWLRDLSVPCDALTLEEQPTPTIVKEPNWTWVPRRKTLEMRPQPGSAKRLLIDVQDPAEFHMAQVGAREGWLQLVWIPSSDWNWGGAHVSGWVRKADVRVPPSERVISLPRGGVRSSEPACESPARVYRGPAGIKPGTKVYASPGTGEWAVVNDSDEVVVELIQPNDDWLAVTRLPGVTPESRCDDLAHAWIPRDAATIPPRRPPDAGGTWTRGPDLPGPARSRFSATLLLDGSVLVVGGSTPGGDFVPLAYILDPKSGAWKKTAPPAVVRSDHTATLLADGRVLVVGGDPPENRAEIFDPARSLWQPAKGPRKPRVGHTAVRLHDGRVLITGGQDPPNKSLATTEIFDPAQGEWTPTDLLTHARDQHTATVLADGRVLVVGGHQGPTEYEQGIIASAEIFDPSVQTWRTTRSMLGRGQAFHTASLLPDGRVLVVGGVVDGGMDSIRETSIAQVFDPISETWSAAADCDPFRPFFARRPFGRERLGAGRAFHTVTPLLDGKLLLVGGGRPSMKPLIFEPRSGIWSFAGSPQVSRFFHAAVRLSEGRVVVIGGFTGTLWSGDEQLTSSVEVYETSPSR